MSVTGEERHRARARALELYYESSLKEREFVDVIDALAVKPDPYTISLLHEVATHEDWALDLLEGHSKEWSLDRMPLLDRLIMTLALCELQSEDSPGRAVIFNEAVEFARTYSTDGSPAFVNGLLSACADAAELS